MKNLFGVTQVSTSGDRRSRRRGVGEYIKDKTAWLLNHLSTTGERSRLKENGGNKRGETMGTLLFYSKKLKLNLCDILSNVDKVFE